VSSALDDDVVRTIDGGRETLGAMLSAAQSHLQKVFILFVIGLMFTIYALREFVWNRMQADLNTNPNIEVVAVTPFDVILLQVKIGLVVGALVALPLLLYYARQPLKERDLWLPDRLSLSRGGIALVSLVSIGLFVAGVSYAYFLFFPLMLDFLASNAVNADFEPTYSIVLWAQFIFLLSLSFGLAAQLPLAMSGLSYTEVIAYETFRDKWKYAVLGIFVFGALFSPPDPFTQIMWAVPLLFLYAFSLGLARVVVTARVSSEAIGFRTLARARWNVLAGVAVVVGAGVYLLGEAVFAGRFDSTLQSLPAPIRPGLFARDALLGLPVDAVLAVVAAVVALLAALLTLLALLFTELEELPTPEQRRRGVRPGETAAPASVGGPADIGLSELDAGGIRAAPPEAFAELTEEEALALAREAMEEDDPDKAEAIFDRFDEAQAAREAQETETVATADEPVGTRAQARDQPESGRGMGDPGIADENASEGGGGDEGSVFTRTGAGMMSAFTDDEVDEDDIGGYYYDLAFVFQSLTSKAFRIVGLFMLVLAGVFVFLYQGGIGLLKEQFYARLPASVEPESVNLVTLHPVEALIFEIKVSTIIAAVATLPLLLYYAWPALKERGFARGDRNVLVTWAGTLAVGLVAGSAVGFLFVAPGIISWLAADVAQNEMVISYRINNFGWLVFFTTVGVGLLLDVPLSMLLFHRGGLVPYRAMRDRWREVTIAVLAIAALGSPKGIFTMFLLGVPIMASYGLGLALLRVYVALGGKGGQPPLVSGQEAD
jgi:sec-independent protein translocase protein TatC